MASQALAVALLSLGCAAHPSSLQNLLQRSGSPLAIDVQWDDVVIESRTTATLQSVVNPLLLANSSIRDNALASLRDVAADHVRFVPWFPYPRLAVPEINPPVMTGTKCSTSWDFSYADQFLGDFLRSTPGVSHIINFSTTPDWMWITESNYTYPEDVNVIDWSYNNGTRLRDPTFEEISDYYSRLVSWYVKGGFTDECGVYHHSGHHYDFQYWEVLNEMEHDISPSYYNQIYDAITAAIHEVSPKTQFVGLALATRNVTYVESFLNPSNHRPGAPLDWISYHFYATPQNSTTQDEAAQSFQQADQFFTEVQQIEAARKRISPHTKTTLDEIGTMDPLGSTVVYPNYTIPDEYWVWSGGIYAYVYSTVAAMGINVVGESQLVGYPSQYPSVSMVDWETGLPNARLRVLQLIQHSFAPGDKIVKTTSDETSIHAQARKSCDGEKKMLLVNKLDQRTAVKVPDFNGGTAEVVDVSTGGHPWKKERVSGETFEVPPYAVVVLTAH